MSTGTETMRVSRKAADEARELARDVAASTGIAVRPGQMLEAMALRGAAIIRAELGAPTTTTVEEPPRSAA